MMDKGKIKILYISHSAELYGAEQCLLQLITNLNKERFWPIVALPQEGPLSQKLAELSIPVEIVPSLRGWLSRKNRVWRLFLLLALLPFIALSILSLRKLITTYQIDLIHTNSLVIIDGALAARIFNVPHIWHAREILNPETVHKFFFGPQTALAIIKHLSERIIAISEAVYQNFQPLSKPAKVKIIYDGKAVASDSDNAVRHKIRRSLGIAADTPLIGEIGQISAVKGHEDLVAAAPIVQKAIPSAVFLAVGDSSRSNRLYKQKISNLIDQYGLQNSFKLIGFRDDIPDILSALDLLVLPSRYEPFGLVLIEAMALGKPVIGTNTGGIPEIIDNNLTGLLVPPRSPADLAQAIIKVLQEPTLAQRLGTAGREKIRSHFNPQQNVIETQKLYEEVVRDR